MVSSADDIYRELVEESEEDWLYGLVAFAVMEERRIEWMEHMETTTGVAPNVDQIREWPARDVVEERQGPGGVFGGLGERDEVNLPLAVVATTRSY